MSSTQVSDTFGTLPAETPLPGLASLVFDGTGVTRPARSDSLIRL